MDCFLQLFYGYQYRHLELMDLSRRNIECSVWVILVCFGSRLKSVQMEWN